MPEKENWLAQQPMTVTQAIDGSGNDQYYSASIKKSITSLVSMASRLKPR